MIVTLLAFIVGGHTFTVPTTPTAVTGLDLPVDLTGRTAVRGTVNVTQSAANAQGVVQCSPDAGANWYTLATFSFAATGSTATSQQAGALDYQAVPALCQRDVRIRSLLQNGANAQVKVTYLALEFR